MHQMFTLKVLRPVLAFTQSNIVLKALSPVFTVEDIVSHPMLSIYYSSEVTVFNEREIMTESGKIIIPDRLAVFQDQTAVIIDYKTGDFYDKHKLQLLNYAAIIEEMGYKVSKKLLVYTEASLQIHEC